MSEWLSRLREFLGRYPRLMRFVLIAGVLTAVGWPVSRLIPRGVAVRYEFGRNHAEYTLFRVAYVPVGQDSARILEQRFPRGAPEIFVHQVELAPGNYEVHARLTNDTDVVEVTGYVTVGRSSEATVRVERPRIPGL